MNSQMEATKLPSVWSGAITRNSDRKKSSEAEEEEELKKEEEEE